MAERRKTPGNTEGIDRNIMELLNEYMVKELLQTKKVCDFIDIFRKLNHVNSTKRESNINIMAFLRDFDTRLTDHVIDLISDMGYDLTCVKVIRVMDILALFHDNQSSIKTWGRLETKVKEHLEEVGMEFDRHMEATDSRIHRRGEKDGYAYWGSRYDSEDEERFLAVLLIEQIQKHGLWYGDIGYTCVTVDGRYPDTEEFTDFLENHPDQTRDRITQQYDGSQVKANEILTSCSVDVNYVENKQRMTISCGIQILRIWDCQKRPENVTLRSQLSGCKRR